MAEIKSIAPIFIARTRSFWLGIVPAALTLFDVLMQSLTADGSEPIAASLAAFLSLFGLTWTGEEISGFMRGLAPLYALIVAQQRAGLARPYVMTRKAERTTEFVIDRTH